MTDIVEQLRAMGADTIGAEAADRITYLGIELSQRQEDIHELKQELAASQAREKVLYEFIKRHCWQWPEDSWPKPNDDTALKAALAAERERCAQVCLAESEDPHNLPAKIVARRCCDTIKALGDQ